jgi:dolichol kinase
VFICLFVLSEIHHFAGFADIVGRKYGTKKLPYNCSESYIGSLVYASASLVYMGYGNRTPTNFLALMPL